MHMLLDSGLPQAARSLQQRLTSLVVTHHGELPILQLPDSHPQELLFVRVRCVTEQPPVERTAQRRVAEAAHRLQWQTRR